MSSVNSSPSTYSCQPPHSSVMSGGMLSASRACLQMASPSSPIEEDRGLRSGPTIRRYIQSPWDKEDARSIDKEWRSIFGRSSHLRTSNGNDISPDPTAVSTALDTCSRSSYDASTSSQSSFLSSSSAVSFASTSMTSQISSDSGRPVSTRTIDTPKVSIKDKFDHRPACVLDSGAAFPHPQRIVSDRPLMTSGSPGFALISLADAQERERLKNQRLGGHPPSPSHRMKTKKSGLLRFFNKTSQPTGVDSFHHQFFPNSHDTMRSAIDDQTAIAREGESLHAGIPVEQVWRKKDLGLKPHLELRPVSMTFAKGLPSSYLSEHETVLQSDLDLSETAGPGGTTLARTDIHSELRQAQKGWQIQLYELEAQIRELRDELEVARRKYDGSTGICQSCGREGAGASKSKDEEATDSVMNRARVKTCGARGVFGTGSLYEWE